jgi:TrmH family RNA methyltransferase
MISKQKIKFISSLRQNKYRLKYHCFIAEGEHVVSDFINSDFKMHSIFCTNEWDQKKSTGIISIITKSELARITALKNPSNVLAVVHKPDQEIDFSILLKEKTIIFLDSVSDPGNMGSIIRTEDWFGIKCIYLSQNCVDIFNPKVVQATMGSLARVKILKGPLMQALDKIKQNRIACYGASLSGHNLYDLKKAKKCAIVFGNESHGISKETQTILDKEILIPSKNKYIDSLNVAVSFGIILSEFR